MILEDVPLFVYFVFSLILVILSWLSLKNNWIIIFLLISYIQGFSFAILLNPLLNLFDNFNFIFPYAWFFAIFYYFTFPFILFICIKPKLTEDYENHELLELISSSANIPKDRIKLKTFSGRYSNNAYVSLKDDEVILGQTLLSKLSLYETVLIVLHEIVHLKKKHLPKRGAIWFLFAIIGTFLIYLFNSLIPINNLVLDFSLLLVFLIIGIVGINQFFWKFEYIADSEAIKIMKNYSAGKSALGKLSDDGKSILYYLVDHPPIEKRIKNLLQIRSKNIDFLTKILLHPLSIIIILIISGLFLIEFFYNLNLSNNFTIPLLIGYISTLIVSTILIRYVFIENAKLKFLKSFERLIIEMKENQKNAELFMQKDLIKIAKSHWEKRKKYWIPYKSPSFTPWSNFFWAYFPQNAYYYFINQEFVVNDCLEKSALASLGEFYVACINFNNNSQSRENNIMINLATISDADIDKICSELDTLSQLYIKKINDNYSNFFNNPQVKDLIDLNEKIK